MIIVFIAGGFDCFHRAHQSILERSKALGDRLIVGINDDAYFAKKGPNRPVDKLAVRMQKVIHSGVVDEVRAFSGESPLDLILQIKPDIITVGDDYTQETTVGYKEAKEWGGRVIILSRTPGISTSQIILDKMREQD